MVSTPQVLLNGALHTAADARVSATSEGFLYGHGVFETIKIIEGRPAFLAQHHARLLASARALDLPYEVAFETLRDRIRHVVTANNLAHGSVKVVVFNDDGSSGGELLVTRANHYPAESYARGFRLKTVFSGERTGALTSHKTLNYLANIRAKRAAVAGGFDEPLFITPAGIVIEGATTNIFVVRDGIAHTPPLASGPLPGIARRQVLELLGSGARETLVTSNDLQHASELFVTNALLGIMPVSRLDDRDYRLGQTPVTHNLLSAYRAREQASLS